MNQFELRLAKNDHVDLTDLTDVHQLKHDSSEAC